ncbi:MAG: hypothetical protein ACP5VE_04685 [Chthonomonadales bacterium]
MDFPSAPPADGGPARAPSIAAGLRYGLLFGLLGASIAAFDLCVATYRLLLEANAPLAAMGNVPDTVPVPRALLWSPVIQELCRRLADLSPASVLALGIGVWLVGVYGLLRALNPTFRLTSGVDWNLSVLTHTYMHTQPVIKVFLIVVTAALPALAFWFGVGRLLGDNLPALWLRLAVLGAAAWVLLSSRGVAGDLDSGNYELPQDPAVLRELIVSGALAGSCAAIAVRMAPTISADGLISFYTTLGGIGSPAWMRMALLAVGAAAALQFSVGGMMAALAFPGLSAAGRLRAGSVPMIVLALTLVFLRVTPRILASRYDYAWDLAEMAPNGYSVAANRLARAAGVPLGAPAFDTVLLMRPAGAVTMNVLAEAVDGPAITPEAAKRVEAFLARRRYLTSLSAVAFRTWHDAATVSWRPEECLRVEYAKLTHCPDQQFLGLFLDKLRSAPATEEVLNYADRLAGGREWVYLTRDARIVVGDIYARLGRREKAQLWYRRAEIPEGRVAQMLDERTMFAGGRLTGRIFLNGAPLAGAKVALVPASAVPEAFRTQAAPGIVRPFWFRWVAASAQTDASGTFRMEHIVAGTYRLIFTSPRVRVEPFSRRVHVTGGPGPLFLGYGRKEMDVGVIRVTAPPPIPLPDRRPGLVASAGSPWICRDTASRQAPYAMSRSLRSDARPCLISPNGNRTTAPRVRGRYG